MNLFQRLKNYFKDDVIRTPEQLADVLRDKNMPDVKIFIMPDEPELKVYDPEEKLKIQLDLKKRKK